MGARQTKRGRVEREFSAGGVVFKKLKVESGKLKTLWLVTKSSPSDLYPKGFWRLPKGWLDDEDGGEKPGPLARGEKRASQEELQKAALKEVREEGGVGAKIVKKISTERQFRGRKILKFVTFYLMEWIKDLPEGPSWETEEVLWLPFSQAKEKLDHEGEREILDKAREILASGIQESLV